MGMVSRPHRLGGARRHLDDRGWFLNTVAVILVPLNSALKSIGRTGTEWAPMYYRCPFRCMFTRCLHSN